MRAARRQLAASIGRPNACLAMLHSPSPGLQARQTSGRTAYARHVVAIPTLPANAEHRLPTQCMPVLFLFT